jgi:hypothetical protein
MKSKTPAPTGAFPANLRSGLSVRSNVRTRHPRLRLGLPISLALEVINFWVIGYPAGPHRISRAAENPGVALQWYLAHLPAIIIGDRSVYIREHHSMESVIFFIAGFIDTALLLLFIFWLAGLARRTLRKLSSPKKELA